MHKGILYPVQYLRAFAALTVYFFHFCAITTGPYKSGTPPIESLGSAGVDLFFVISGFVMAMLVWERKTTFSEFLFARLTRVVPLYWCGTIAVFIVALVTPSLLGSTQANLSQLFYSLIFIPYGEGSALMPPILNVGWTLNYEMFFYLLVALSAGILNDRSLTCVGFFICALVLLGALLPSDNIFMIFYLNPIILEFPMGIVVFHCWRLGLGNFSKFLSGSLMLVSFVSFFVLFNENSEQHRAVYWGIPSAVFLFAALNFVTSINGFLKQVGDWSYSIYLLHVFVIMAFHKILYPVTALNQLPDSIYFLIVTGTLLVVSGLSYRYFEMPVQAWCKKHLKPKVDQNMPVEALQTSAHRNL